MTTKAKVSLVLGAVALLAIGFALGNVHARSSFGSTEQGPSYLIGDVYQGVNGTLQFQSGKFVGPVASGNPVSLTGSFAPDSTGSSTLRLAATSTPQTLTAAQLCTVGTIEWPTTTSTGELTLPTAVALQAACLGVDGGTRTLIVRNTDSVATSSFSLTAGASSTISTNFATSSQASGDILAGQAAELKLVFGTSSSASAKMIHILASFFR